MFTIFGATGHTGAAVADALLARGKQIRIVVRDAAKAAAWRARGAEIVVGSLDDVDAIERALHGAEGAYLLLPPDPTASALVASRAQKTDRILKALGRVRPQRIVFLSSIASHIFGEQYAEQRLVPHGVTFLRAPYFMSNWGAVLPAARADGVLPTFIRPDQRIPTVSPSDIGAHAAKLLLEGASDPIVEITGPDEYTPDDVARVLANLLGRPVRSLALANDAVVPTFTSMGITPDFAELFRQLYAAIDAERLPWLRPASVVRGATTLEAELAKLV